MTDLDRRIERRIDALSKRANRLTGILVRLNERRSHDEWRVPVMLEIADLHAAIATIRRSSEAYDRAFREANEDPTGQALDDFQASE